jgi:serine/threonine protein kinase
MLKIPNFFQQNVFIGADGVARLGDFGLATFVDEMNQHTGLTTSEVGKGSWWWMAPELFSGEKKSLEGDMYAFAGLLLEVNYMAFSNWHADVSLDRFCLAGHHISISSHTGILP